MNDLLARSNVTQSLCPSAYLRYYCCVLQKTALLKVSQTPNVVGQTLVILECIVGDVDKYTYYNEYSKSFAQNRYISILVGSRHPNLIILYLII